MPFDTPYQSIQAGSPDKTHHSKIRHIQCIAQISYINSKSFEVHSLVGLSPTSNIQKYIYVCLPTDLDNLHLDTEYVFLHPIFTFILRRSKLAGFWCAFYFTTQRVVVMLKIS
jgi:hypothetical protein